jgi:hypothetical protein
MMVTQLKALAAIHCAATLPDGNAAAANGRSHPMLAVIVLGLVLAAVVSIELTKNHRTGLFRRLADQPRANAPADPHRLHSRRISSDIRSPTSERISSDDCARSAVLVAHH